MFYDRFKALCEAKGVSCNRAAIEIGLSNATPTTWKNRSLTPKADTLVKIADYFGVTVGSLLDAETEKAPTPVGERITMDDFTYAMQNETKDLTDMDKQILLSMAKQLNDARKRRDEKT